MALIIMTRIFFTLNLLLFGGFCHGQSQLTTLISPAGGSYHSNSFKTLWTIGEITGATSRVNNVRIQQGFIQPGVSATVTGTEQLFNPKLSIYPNPADEFVNILYNTSINDLKFKFFDSQGLLLETWTAENMLQVKKLDISNYTPGVYLLVVESQSPKQNMKYKIIKAYINE
ncbi:T9SS type A sorting domain-containing protein [Fulvivirga sp. 29W222]|uniref:T9SS type A sorting domain-containing protein n=1 Tax=Fulvivirga marina TaxID=2494733 RepID=A0A937KCI6_9BACT|nr:T9SS type A sorting domain-containing protein [Fulvivirga marina]MBL6447424.1 T9SS type A sorting domain-containing protein [Fulvivirga marina]